MRRFLSNYFDLLLLLLLGLLLLLVLDATRVSLTVRLMINVIRFTPSKDQTAPCRSIYHQLHFGQGKGRGRKIIKSAVLTSAPDSSDVTDISNYGRSPGHVTPALLCVLLT